VPPADDSIWIAMLPTFGPQARSRSIPAILKLARGAELAVERSVVAFLDERGATAGELSDAFGLVAGTRLDGPLARALRDDRPRPACAAWRWTLDDRQTATVASFDARPDAGELVLWCAPLHVPVPDDHQLVVQYVNVTDNVVDLPRAIRDATLWVDGVAHRSRAGGHWDGRGHVQPGGSSQQRFRMSDFEGAPTLGIHDVALEMFGLRTITRSLHLVGEVWRPHS
jgi:hypothetical protein